MEAAEKLMMELEEKGYGNRYADMQQRSAPKVDSSFVGKRLEVLCQYYTVGQRVRWVQCNKLEARERGMGAKKNLNQLSSFGTRNIAWKAGRTGQRKNY